MLPPDADELVIHSLFAQRVALGYSSFCGKASSTPSISTSTTATGPGFPIARALGSGFITSRIAPFATNVQFQRAFFFPSLFHLYKD